MFVKNTQSKLSILAAFCFLVSISAFSQPLTGTYTLPGTVNGSTVNNLSQLSTVLNSATVNGTAVFEFTSSYTSTGESYPIIFTAFSGTGNVIIRPDSSVITPLTTSGSPASLALVVLSGVKNLTFDGRPGGKGGGIEWQFQNTASGGTYPAFQLMNGAQYDALKYLTVQGSGTNTTGTINLSTSSAGGNSYDTIEYCNISSYSAYAYIQIYSNGSASPNANSNNSILNNNISNFQSFTQNAAPTQGGIIITATGNGSNWNISGNSIYCTGAPYLYSTPIGAISFNPGSTSVNNIISGNYIGGQSPLCAGGQMKIVSYQANGYPDFDGIYCSAGTATISNNAIKNIYMGSKYGSSTFCGINVAGSGAYTVSNNIIGSPTDTNNIVSGINGTMLGIWNQSSGAVTIDGNTIANFTSNYRAFVNGTSSQTPGAITGIYDYAGSSGNIGATRVTNNQIFNLSCASNYNNNLYFYINSSGSNGANFPANTYDNPQNNVVCGIMMEQDNTNTNTQLISKNTIYGLNSTVTGGTNISYITGIVANGNTSGTNIINGNFIYGSYAPNTYGSSGTYYIGLTGIYLPTGKTGKYFLQDNIIDLGYRSTDGSSVQNALIYGIWEDNYSQASTNLKEYVYHNSVYIGGSDNSSVYSFAFARNLFYGSTVYDSLTIMNNIFVNNRTTSSTGKQYGLYLNSTIDVQDDYNDVYGTGTNFYYGAANGSNYNTKAAFQVGNPGFEVHSISADPQYVSPTTATPNLHINNTPNTSPIEQAGTSSYTITYDFDSLLRANYSPVDLGATIDCASSSPTSVALSVSQDTVCAGSSVTFTATGTNGGSAPVYNFYLNGNSVQNGSSNTYTLSSLNNGDSVKVKITGNSPCASVDTAFSNSITEVVNSVTLVPTVTLSASRNNVCQGDSITFTATPANGGVSPTYKFYVNGVGAQFGTSTAYTAALNNNDSVFVILNSNAGCLADSHATSNKIGLIVNPVVAASVTLSASQTTICAGDSVVLTATATNGGTAPQFIFYINTVAVQQGPLNTFTTHVINNNDSIWVHLQGNAACASPANADAPKIHFTVSSGATPTVVIHASQTTICPGTLVTFTGTATNGGSTPKYNFYLNGVSVQNGFSNSYSSDTLNNNDSVWVVLTSNASCASTTTATSSTLHITSGSSVTPTVNLGISQNNFCAGTLVTFTATSTNAGNTPTYAFYINGVLKQNTSNNTYSTTALNNNDSIFVVLYSSATCASPSTATSALIKALVTPSVTPTVTLSASQTNICSGTSVTFTASGTNGGSGALYNFYVDGISVQNSPSNSYSSTSLENADSIWVVISSNATCASPSQVQSNMVRITVGTTVIPSVSLNPSQNNVCPNATVIFAASPTNGGNAPQYNFYVNGTSVQNGSLNTYTASSLNNNDSVWVVLISNAACASPSHVTSTKIIMSVHQSVAPSVVLTVDKASSCTGETVNFTASPSGGGATPNYQFFNGNTSVQTSTSNIWSSNTLTTGAKIYVYMTSNSGCASPASVYSDTVVIQVHPVSGSSQTASICPGSSYSFYSQSLTQPGTYYDTLSTVFGCDSIITLNLSSGAAVQTHITDNVCSGHSYNFNGQVLGSAGTYTDTLAASGGCDSVVILQLTVKHGASSQIVDSICLGDTYNFNGRSITAAGVYHDTLSAANTCDSVVTLILFVTSKSTPTIYQVGRDSLLTTAYNTYQWLVNDSVISGATNEVYIATRDGHYAVVVTNASGCKDTSAAYSYIKTGLANLSDKTAVQLYPNPTTGELNIQVEGLQTGVLITKLYDLQGQVIYASAVSANTNNTFTINIANCAAGLYYLQMQSDDWNEVKKVELVK